MRNQAIVHEGTARELFWRNGRWHDVDFYGILESDWFRREPAG